MESKMNLGEADIVVYIYKKLKEYGVKVQDIAILTPYSKQVSTIKSILTNSPEGQLSVPEVSTIDGIQGR